MQPVEPRILRGLKIFVIEKKAEMTQFLAGLATANALYIQISSLDKGSTSAVPRRWHATGIDVLAAYCGPTAKKK